MLEICIPDNALANCTDLREKTVRTGSLGRTAAIFRVNRIVVYRTGRLRPDQLRDTKLLPLLLKYMDVPQYLRKTVYQKAPALKYVGLLPPLRTRSHPLIDSAISEGDLRWGIQVQPGVVDIGLSKTIAHHEKVSEQEPTLFRIVSGPPSFKLEKVDRSKLRVYFGYEVETENDLIGRLRKSSITKIVFSRSGVPYQEAEKEIAKTVSATLGLTAVFGAPTEGVREIFVDRQSELDSVVDAWVNAVEDQGTETVRLEEALPISLGLLNDSFGRLATLPGFYGNSAH